MVNKNLIDKIGKISDQIKELEAQKKELIDQLGPLEYDTYAGKDYRLVVEVNRRFDAGTAKTSLTKKQYESILKLTPDNALAKATLTPEQYAKCQRVFAPKKTFKRYED